MSERETYFPVFARENQLRFAWVSCQVLNNQRVQVKVNERGVIVACSLAKAGCRVFKGMCTPQGKECIVGKKLNFVPANRKGDHFFKHE